ncbi:MAG: hypothetical protein HYU66_05990 [Armatimonadetes bacterium]|nr:hypothetical protein [Armatimonadota bacterium]
MGDTFYFIPHTHWEGAVFKTREEYLEMGLPIILRALKLLREHPGYRFTLDQVCYVKPFLERYPEERAAFEQFVAEGRLGLVGGMISMPDDNMPGGESFVRQMLLGKRWYRAELGVDITTGWLLDTFGHHSQVPQLLARAGYRSFWFFRGVADWDVPGEFWWEGLDGTRIAAFWLAHGYAVTYGSPADEEGFARFMEQRFELLAPVARGPIRNGPAGADVCDPEPHAAPHTAAFNARPDRPFELRLAVPADYEAAAAGLDRTVVRGELNPIFQGIYSSRIELKQVTREIERLLLEAEQLGTLGAGGDDGVLDRAWEPMLFNHAHDLMSGVMTDHVYADTVGSYEHSRRLAAEERDERLRAYLGRIDTRGDGIPVVVWNSLSWARTDLVTVNVGLAEPGVRGLRLFGPDGAELPLQAVRVERHADGSLLRVELAFLARGVPACGHAVYRLVPGDEPMAQPGAEPSSGRVVLENSLLRAVADSGSGALHSLKLADGWEALAGPANVVAREDDHGDLWEPYHSLDGGSRIAMTTRHPAPARDAAVFSDEPGEAAATLTRGPVFSELRVQRALGDGAFETILRVTEGLGRIDIRTRLVNAAEFVRYRVLFPTTIQDGRSVQEIPFGAVERPEGIEFPAQTWADWSDGAHGLAVLNRGLPGNNVADGVMLLSLLRSTRIVAYGFGGGYEPGMTSDTGLALGREFTLDYALCPHQGDWRAAELPRRGGEFGRRLTARTADQHPGDLPPTRAGLEVDAPNVVVSAVKRGVNGGVVVRLYEALGEPAAVTLRWAGGIREAAEVNLIEDEIGSLPVEGGRVWLEMGAFEIRTIRLA